MTVTSVVGGITYIINTLIAYPIDYAARIHGRPPWTASTGDTLIPSNHFGFRRGIALLAGIALSTFALVPTQATAQTYPDKTIRLVVPYPPGGATDVIGRVLGQKLTGILGQQVIVDNRAGAAGNIGAASVAKEKPDGYTLLMGAMTSHSINSVLFGSVARFDIVKDFAPIAVVGHVPLVIVINPRLKAKDLSELIALAKTKPGTLTYASSGNGSPQHLAGEMFQRSAGIKLLHVPYKGSSPALTDLMGGQVDLMIDTVPAAQSFIKSGKLIALATATSEPVATLPGVPTAAQAGLKGFEVSSMFAVAAPAGTSASIIAKLSNALKSILEQSDVKDALLAQGVIATYTTPSQATVALRDETAKWAKVIKDGDIKAD